MNTVNLNIDEFKKEFHPTDEIIIYGNGELGQVVSCFFEFMNQKKCVIKVVDNRHGNGLKNTILDLPVEAPATLSCKQNQKIIIASLEHKDAIFQHLTQDLNIDTRSIFALTIPSSIATSGEHNEFWNEGIASEVYFWIKSLATRHHIERACTERANPEKPFYQNALNVLDSPEGSKIEVLDVGSGPVTMLGYKAPEYHIKLTCIDPLADEYKNLYRQFEFFPPVEPIACSGEDLLKQFSQQSFDLVFSCNALDHASYPLKIIQNMCELLKEQGALYIIVHENEGEHAGYTGLHQWNFQHIDGEIILWNKEARYSLNEELKPFGELHFIESTQQARELHFYLNKSVTTEK